ncbi:MAG: alpha/beta hydrolase [Halieaceae bacterium]|jgi:alpha-beta hydrolase superfamily lysophospholipase|nr:alpha/beta hydrolase [Halieaceae bacterium]
MSAVEAQESTIEGGVFTRRWNAAEPRAAVLLAHGLGEHSGRYQYFAEALVARGISVWAPDHPGHGRSPGTRCHIKRFADFFPALDALRSAIDEQHPGLPCFLVGHSMGGLIAGAYLLDRQAGFAGAAFSGAAFDVPAAPGAAALFINRLIAALLPKLGVLQLDASEISRDPQVVQHYIDDPLVHSGKISARLVVELFSTMAELRERRGELTLPMLVMHGEADAMTPASGSQAFFEGVASTEKTLRLYPGLYHEIFNEPERDQVIGELGDWLDARVNAA